MSKDGGLQRGFGQRSRVFATGKRSCRLAKSVFPLKGYILKFFISFQQSCVSLFLVTDNVEKDVKMVDVNQSGELLLV